MKKILFEPLGGLCNRLRALASALSLGSALEKEIWLLWRRDWTLNCDFDDLFIRPSAVTRIISLHGQVGIRFADLLSALGCDRRWDQDEILQGMREGYDFTEVGQYSRPLLRTEERFFKPTDFAAFHPVASLQEKIDAYRPQLEGAIGLHLRRTDNIRAREASPTDLFIEAIDKELDLDAATRVFLATDDPVEEVLLKRRYGERLFFHPKQVRGRDDPLAIRDAVVDLYCLSMCRRIYGSYWSSFSEMASEIGSVELHILRSPREGKSGC
ncbi:MAG: hypothetical protein C0616_14760 [Desulfuromonas sp.]|nr:MAG: hypothetical protein C0616_14760 [Desulfuromonas sp.]